MFGNANLLLKISGRIFHTDPWRPCYRPHPKDGEGNSFTLLVCPQVGGGGVRSSRGGVRSSCRGGSGPAWGGQVLPGGGQIQPGGVRSSWQGGSGPAGRGGVRSSCQGGGQVQLPGGGSASCALLRAVCLLRSRRRTFLLNIILLHLSLETNVLCVQIKDHFPKEVMIH